MSANLRDGSTTGDPRLDLLFDKDPRNRNHPVSMVTPARPERVDKEWPRSPVTDQGEEGACVGHGETGFALAMTKLVLPITIPADHYAYDWYHASQHGDDWNGCSLGTGCPVDPQPEVYGGTSVKSGGQTGVTRGYYREYRWAFGIDQALDALTSVGPLVLGVPWYSGMYEAPGGKVTISGDVIGGHCIKADAIFWSTEEVEWQNSWGLAYGINGRARISFADLDRLLREGGECQIPIAA